VAKLQDTLRGQMTTPYFSVHFELLAAKMKFVQVGSELLKLGTSEISLFELTHPEGASGHRISNASGTIVYVTNHEHGMEVADRRLLERAKDAKLLIYDAQFTPEEYPSHRGWDMGPG
jgi:phosphoribosyl 1,2-cyclic phosphodiesterase